MKKRRLAEKREGLQKREKACKFASLLS